MRWPKAWIQWLTRLRAPKPLGQRGEEAAARFLRRRGYHILAQGSRSRWGEIDLVAADQGTIVFVEVKTRQTDLSGQPEEAVDAAKQRRLTQLAVAWLKRHRLLDRRARFDVVAVVWPEGQRRPAIQHFPNAFDAAGQGGMYS